MELPKHWNGRLFGTNTGNLSATIELVGDQAKVEARFLDDAFGPVVYSLTGSWASGNLEVTGRGQPTNPDVVVGDVTISGSRAQDGRLVGTWKSTVGTGGSFILHPHEFGAATASEPGASTTSPEQLHIVSHRLGAIRLYRSDVLSLIDLTLQGFSAQRLAITYDNGTTNSVMWSDEFIKSVTRTSMKYLKLSASTQIENGATRTVVVEFGSLYNEITVQGDSQVWVTGQAELMRKFLSDRQSRLASQFKLWNVSISQALILMMIVIMPSLPSLNSRAAFGILVAAVVVVLSLLHARLIPMSEIDMGDRRPSLMRFWPAWVSWIASIAAALIIAKASGFIDGTEKARDIPPTALATAAPSETTTK